MSNWKIKQCDELCQPGREDAPSVVEVHPSPWIEIGAPVEIQEALMSKGLLSDSVLEDGEAEYCKWVAEKDWAYQCTFTDPGWTGSVRLVFGGLDTVSDIYLNGRRIGGSKTMYLPLTIDVTGALLEQNELLVYFHAFNKVIKIYGETMPDEWRGIVSPGAMLRKSGGDFGSYLGAVPCFTPIGIFGDVCLESPDAAEISVLDIDTSFHFDYTQANIRLEACGHGNDGNIEMEFEFLDEDGRTVFLERKPVEKTDTVSWKAESVFSIADPHLWWPKNYGAQPLYTMKAAVFEGGVLRDAIVRVTGLREVKMGGSLKFVVNGKPVKLWGANVGPIGGLSHRWEPAPAIAQIDLADKCNMNALRLWGPSKSYGEELYLEADRRGFMLWQDFFTGSAQLPNNEEYKSLFLAEAEHLVRRLKHHPSIFVWCGGNENIHMCEYLGITSQIGHEILFHDFRELCHKLDPHRYYHDTCPIGGRFSNDPSFGDTHGNRAFLSYLPGEENAVFYSEDIRTAPPKLDSLKRFIKGADLWPEGYSDIMTFGVVKPMPETWARRTQNFAERKFGSIEQYYDATDAESLVYKFGAAAGQSYHNAIANCRQGKAFYESANERKCNGYILWKLNNTWPAFYCGIVDYYMEPYIPYYAVKRAFAPVFIHIDVKDHIYVWGVNDTIEEVTGMLTITQVRLSKNAVERQLRIHASIPAGESKTTTNLDSFGFIWKDSILHAELTSDDGTVLARAYGFLDMERHLAFPESRLAMKISGDCLEISTDSFARCVEISGDENGDRFGWYFDDNYFDLMPYETRRIRISGRHTSGLVSAKAHYSRHMAEVTFNSAKSAI